MDEHASGETSLLYGTSRLPSSCLMHVLRSNRWGTWHVMMICVFFVDYVYVYILVTARSIQTYVCFEDLPRHHDTHGYPQSRTLLFLGERNDTLPLACTPRKMIFGKAWAKPLPQRRRVLGRCWLNIPKTRPKNQVTKYDQIPKLKPKSQLCTKLKKKETRCRSRMLVVQLHHRRPQTVGGFNGFKGRLQQEGQTHEIAATLILKLSAINAGNHVTLFISASLALSQR